ncbi:MAG: hypothetical protein QXO40_04255 [Candidatus Aenigmatarchaeota archaeon]
MKNHNFLIKILVFLPCYRLHYDIIFDALGLTEEERKEVYYAVAELVKNRLEKSRSV